MKWSFGKHDNGTWPTHRWFYHVNAMLMQCQCPIQRGSVIATCVYWRCRHFWWYRWWLRLSQITWMPGTSLKLLLEAYSLEPDLAGLSGIVNFHPRKLSHPYMYDGTDRLNPQCFWTSYWWTPGIIQRCPKHRNTVHLHTWRTIPQWRRRPASGRDVSPGLAAGRREENPCGIHHGFTILMGALHHPLTRGVFYWGANMSVVGIFRSFFWDPMWKLCDPRGFLSYFHVFSMALIGFWWD